MTRCVPEKVIPQNQVKVKQIQYNMHKMLDQEIKFI